MEITFSLAELKEQLAFLIKERFLSIGMKDQVTVTEIRMSDDTDGLLTAVFTLGHSGVKPPKA